MYLQEIQTIDYIDQQIQKFNFSDAAIAELNKKYMALKINGVDDKEGYKAVKTARLNIKSRRVSVEKLRKELTADVLLVQRKVNEEAKRITVQLEVIEDHCEKQESWVDQEKERLKIEAEEKEKIKIKERYDLLLKHGMKFDGFKFEGNYIDNNGPLAIGITAEMVKSQNDEQFGEFIGALSNAYYATLEHEEKKRKEEKEKKRLLDEERHNKELDLIQEKTRLQSLAEQQAMEIAAIKLVIVGSYRPVEVNPSSYPPDFIDALADLALRESDKKIEEHELTTEGPVNTINAKLLPDKMEFEAIWNNPDQVQGLLYTTELVRGKYTLEFMATYMDNVEMEDNAVHDVALEQTEKRYGRTD